MNPIVAIVLWYFVAFEEITVRTLFGAILVVGSVVLTMTEPSEMPLSKRYGPRERRAISTVYCSTRTKNSLIP